MVNHVTFSLHAEKIAIEENFISVLEIIHSMIATSSYELMNLKKVLLIVFMHEED